MKKFTIITAAALALSLAGCGSKAPEPEKPDITGYYELTGMVNSGEEMASEELELLRDMGMIVFLDIKDDTNAELNVFGDPMDLTYDLGAMKFYAEDEEIDFTYEDGVIVLSQDEDSMTLTKTERPAAEPTPEATSAPIAAPAASAWAGISAKRVGMDDIGYFNIPEDWVDQSKTEDPAAITLHYWSADGTYSLMVYSYTKAEWEPFGSEYGELDTWIGETARGTAEEYADILTSEIYDLPVFINGYNGTRADLLFSDDSALTNVIFKDDAETIHIITMETFTADSTAQINDFTNYVVDSFTVDQ